VPESDNPTFNTTMVVFPHSIEGGSKKTFDLVMSSPFLKALAPTQSELPFLLTQLVILALFVALGIVSTIRFRVAHA
jgi:hypothetical protein